MSFPNHVGAPFKQAAVWSYFSFKVLGGSRESLSGTRRKECINYIAGIDEEKERKGKRTRCTLEKSMLYVLSKVFGLFTRVFFRFTIIALYVCLLCSCSLAKKEERIKSTTSFLILGLIVSFTKKLFRELLRIINNYK